MSILASASFFEGFFFPTILVGGAVVVSIIRDNAATRLRLQQEASEQFGGAFYEDEVAVPDPRDALGLCQYLGFLGLKVAALAFLFGLIWSTFYIFTVIALVGALVALGFWIQYRFFAPPSAVEGLESVAFRRDHLVLVERLTGNRRVVLLDEQTRMTIVYREVYHRLYFFRLTLQRVELDMVIKDAAGEVTVPLSFNGAGNFISICRGAGVHLVFAEDTSVQKDFVRWASKISHSFDPPPAYAPYRATPKMVDLVCESCGARASYEATAKKRTCQYCSSPDLSTR